jgi:type II secretory pathway component PulM
MSLDIYLEERRPVYVFEANVTHNLGAMADAAGIYQHLWRPEELGITQAGDLIAPLRAGIAAMKADPAKFEALNPKNGRGSYEHFIPWLERHLAACEEHPEATIRARR